ncbi:hypothetical protein [Alloyangia pacifica]|uniref:hypothetical protein n=1 Tax=Alloyangia pacifica TaxID=311180 RepID=UPI001CFC8531|nr:hypothetical protein [Alloyangia pacifica]
MPHELPRLLTQLPELPRRLFARAHQRAVVARRTGSDKPDTTAPPVAIPIRAISGETEARRQIFRHGLRLARQEQWSALVDALSDADRARAMTPAGTSASRLLCDGAVQDTLCRASAPVAQGDAEAARGIAAGFCRALGPTTEAPMRALIAASAHLGLARLWRAAPAASLPVPRRRAAVQHHLETAHLLLRPHAPDSLGSAALQAAHCAVIEVLPRPEARLARDYDALIALEPACPAHLRAYGNELSPHRFGTWPELERQARRIAMMTAEVWGGGGYCWLWLDVLAAQPEGLAHLDTELFVAGLHDLLQIGRGADPGTQAEASQAHQHRANLLAAWCSRLRHETAPASALQSRARARIAACLDWIVSDHLRELHPALWAPGRVPGGALDPRLPASEADALTAQGTAAAQAALRDLFAHHVSRGRSVVFTDQGIALKPGGCTSCTLAPCAALAYPRRNLRDEDPPCLT